MTAEYNNALTLAAPKEFNFQENLRYLSRSNNECMFHIEDNKIYKVIPVEHVNPLVEISINTDGNIQIRFLGESYNSEKWVCDAVANYVIEWFDFTTDLAPFYTLAKHAPLLQGPIQDYYGLRTLGIPDLFEALSWGIIGQQINLAYAYTLKKRLVEQFGSYVKWNDRKHRIFPSPETIANLHVEDLKKLKMTTRKCEYLIGIARLITEGKLSKESLLQTQDVKIAEKQLTAIHGIGPWTAHYVLMRCLRFPSAFPIDDVGLHNAIKFITGSENKPTKHEIKDFAANWTNWESYAAFYLWRVLY
ncbi:MULTISPECIES: DNA-3-methyladenine glycosylase 2 [Bacillus cereus group]|uniref:DNA-3-methyladenine glycosylase 2 n=1 Tax=Bacillus cereus group TaxID=86661 RepID=UPI000BECDB14|nr:MULTISPECIES: DNA-3-methyladenine glycosylase [Bacillus cereus group]MBJ7929938.1 DNA-3-methyladenine glycosylase 2 family protein [Bacillus cereus group sp. N31]PEG15088.1 DNA-3-methyladenine glycosylase [Bacillus toyonensis]PEK09540.1 DNA-3-methyladenine glycosylase [Bacillus toyonensis]PFZ71919.1 DNA-3-methyladenine glycosylase [Bacillus toyonensis]PGA03724.1 DNA-3-methyladenine glycosylase [Bacillus toyonensis]